MRVLNVNSSLGLKTGGGTAERTFHMSRFLALAGIPCTVLTLTIGLDSARIKALAPATIVALPCFWQRFYVPRINLRQIRRLVDDADIIHLMGHWGVLNAVVYLMARRVGKPYVVCPAGALPLFGRSSWLKGLYNFVIGRDIIRNADAGIAVTAAELSHFASYAVPASRLTVIPNGVDSADFAVFDKAAILARGVRDEAFILFMGRLNPIKGPDLLLEAFARVCGRLQGCQLVFAGPDGGMLSQLQAAIAGYGLEGRVHLLGHVDGDLKAALYNFAELLVVPSRQEAMSIVALEAGICGTPVLLTETCGFSEICEVDSRLEVPATVDALADGLMQLLADRVALSELGPRLRQFVEGRYAWSALIPSYVKLYQEIIVRRASK